MPSFFPLGVGSLPFVKFHEILRATAYQILLDFYCGLVRAIALRNLYQTDLLLEAMRHNGFLMYYVIIVANVLKICLLAVEDSED